MNSDEISISNGCIRLAHRLTMVGGRARIDLTGSGSIRETQMSSGRDFNACTEVLYAERTVRIARRDKILRCAWNCSEYYMYAQCERQTCRRI